MKKLIIYDASGNPKTEYNVPKFVDKAHEYKWAARMFKFFRDKAKDQDQVDHWDLVEVSD